MVYRMVFTYDEIEDIMNINNIVRETNRYKLPQIIQKISDRNLMLKF